MGPAEEYITSSKKYDWRTPDELYLVLDNIFHFDLDVAAEDWNTKCERFFTPEMDALIRDWFTKTYWFLNPPWGNQYKVDTGMTLKNWLIKAFNEFKRGNQGVMLCPENLTSIYINDAIKKVPYILMPRGRVKFIDPNRIKPSQPTKGTVILLYVNNLSDEQVVELNKMGILYSRLNPKPEDTFIPP